MSRQKLTIIVTCTDRKSATPRPALMARNLPSGQVDARARVCATALSRSQPVSSLGDLCSGDIWSQVKRLIATSRALGAAVEVLVAPAGLGLRSLGDRAPAYAATFSAGHPASVAASLTDAQ